MYSHCFYNVPHRKASHFIHKTRDGMDKGLQTAIYPNNPEPESSCRATGNCEQALKKKLGIEKDTKLFTELSKNGRAFWRLVMGAPVSFR